MRRTFLMLCLAVAPMTTSSAQRAPIVVPQNLATLPDLSVMLPDLSAIQPALEMAQVQLQAVTPLLAQVDMLQLDGIELAEPEATLPPRAWDAQDPADSLYRAAREALNNEDYARAASIFRQIARLYPKSEYASDAPYWEAFALYRDGGQRNLNRALNALERQRDRYPNAATRRDADALTARIRGELAKMGEANQAAAVAELAEQANRANRASRATRAGRAGGASRADSACTEDDDNDIRLIALNALLQMDSERALPILQKVLARRGPCTEVLRRKAVFLVAQKAHSDEGADILLDVARTDPDPEVRQQAVFWLSQVPSDRAVAALDSILHSANDPDLQEKAIFALSQHPGDRSAKVLHDFAESNAPEELRGKAIFWIGQMQGASNGPNYLRDLYGRVQSETLKERIIQAVSQSGGSGNAQWLLGIAKDQSSSIELRKKALFWAGQQTRIPLSDLIPLYDTIGDKEMKQYFIFTLSQRPESAATDKLIDIAKNDRDPEMRKKAIFWLSQRDDPRVQQLLLDLINK